MMLFLTMAMGLAALSIDLAWMRLAAAQAQDVADAAAAAALIELRRTGDPDLAEDAAQEFVARNVVGRGPAELLDVEFGRWDEEGQEFSPDPVSPHAVRVVVGRPEDNPLDLYFAQLAGQNTFSVERESIAATRSMQVVLVIDITQSFQSDIGEARAAAIAFLDLLTATHGEYDMVGMVLYYNRFGVEYTPLRYLDDEAWDHAARTQWAKINTASQPNLLYFLTGGRNPAMPRQYPDEGGTDHHPGLAMALTMFSERPDPFAFRAVVVLTDGNPTNLTNANDRTGHGYTETRWRQYRGPIPHAAWQSRLKTLEVADRLWAEQDVHVWSISYDAKEQFLKDMTTGVGKFYYTEDAADLTAIFAEIASSLPVAAVR